MRSNARESRFPVENLRRVDVSSGEDDTLKQTRENENRNGVSEAFRCDLKKYRETA